MRKRKTNMAGSRLEEECSVKSLISCLCKAIVENEDKIEKYKWKSNPLKLPHYLQVDTFKNKDNVTKHLFKTCYDLLLLRRNEWYNKWITPLSPSYRCLAYGYDLHQIGQTYEADRLMTLLDSEVILSHEYSDSILTFLAILSNKPIIDNHSVPLQTLNEYTIYPDHIFEAVPGTSSLHYPNNKFLSRSPGTGLMGFCTQDDIHDNLCSSNSTLFGGLTHTTTPTLNTILHIPSLTNQMPPDMFDRYMSKYNVPNQFPKEVSLIDSITRDDSVIDLIDKVGVIDEAPPISWEGLIEERPYLSECGTEGFQQSSLAYNRLTARVGRIDSSHFVTNERTIIKVTSLSIDLINCEEMIDRLNDAQFANNVSNNFYNGVRCIINTCRVKLDQLLSMKDSTELKIQLYGKDLRRLIIYSKELLKLCHHDSKALDVLNNLYKLCKDSEGLPSYQLMIGLFRQSIKPYLSVIEMWVYSGQYMKLSGIITDETSLETKDHTYWTKGFSLALRDVPECMQRVANDLVNAGRSLNLLNLICPKHHLCNGRHRTPQLILAQTLQELTDTCRLFTEYQVVMGTMEDCHKEQRMAEIEEEKVISISPIVAARRKAQKYMNDIKQKEINEAMIKNDKKHLLMVEQQRELQQTREYRMKMVALDRERDELLMVESNMGQKENELKEQAKADLIDYYQKLNRQAELRLARAQWRARRFELATARILHPDKEIQLEEEALNNGDEIIDTGSEIIDTGSEIIDTGSEIIDTGSEIFVAGSDNGDTGFEIIDTGSDDGNIIAGSGGTSSMSLIENENVKVQLNSEVNERGLLVPLSHPSQSTIQDVLYKDDNVFLHVNTRGDTPQSNIQELMYPYMMEEQQEREQMVVEREEIIIEEGSGNVSKGSGSIMVDDRYGNRDERLSDIDKGSSDDVVNMGSGDDVIMGSNDDNVNMGSGDDDVVNMGSGDDVVNTGSSDDDVNMRSSDDDVNMESNDVSKESSNNEKGSNNIDKGSGTDKLCYSRYNTDLSLSSAPPHGNMPKTTPTTNDSSLLLCSLDTVIDHCILQPISIQSTIVNKAVINYFINELNIKQHFVCLKKFLFLEDGDFSTTLSSELFDKLTYDHCINDLCSNSFLQSLLSSALECSHYNTLVSNLELKTKYRPKALQSTSIKSLDYLILNYKVTWPLNIIIRQFHINCYNKVFQLMLEIKRCSWTLNKVFLRLAKGYNNVLSATPSQLRLIHVQRQELQHFVTVMGGYISNQIFHVSWKQFETQLDQVSSLDELIKAHDKYLDTIIFKCLLVKKTYSILNLIEECLACVLKFCSQLLTTDIFQTAILSSIHKKFHEISALLFKVITKLVQRGFQPHMEDLLMRLNFNRFYK